MNADDSKKERIARLQELRSDLANAGKIARDRLAFGPSLARSFHHAVGHDLVIDDFVPEKSAPVSFAGRTLKDASDWCVLNVAEEEALNALVRISECIKSHQGLIGIQGNSYLGLYHATSVSLSGMIRVAAALHDSTVFFPTDDDAGIIVDSYREPSGLELFSIYVKGAALSRCLSVEINGIDQPSDQ